MLKAFKDYNNLSPELRKRLNENRELVGKTAKYKFYIAHKNPDGQHLADGEYIYPAVYTLTPVTYEVLDPGDKVYKPVGMARGMERYGEVEEIRFGRISLPERLQGFLWLDLNSREHIEMFEFLEMHPKMEGGMFRDKNSPAMFVRLDELKEAKTKNQRKELRSAALMYATRMAEKDVRDFAAAMNWNELEDLDILKDRLTDIADKDPEFFRKFVDDPSVEYKAIIRRAIDANVISWVPVENKFIWTSNGTTIALLDKTEGDKYFDRMSDWFITHKNGQDTFKKIKSLLSGKQ
jgi:hypothetical protein